MKISIIAAIGKNRELGKDNKLIWHIKEDLQRFRNLTRGHPVIMGRKTWESLPVKPLPNRTNIVITQNSNLKAQIYSSNLKTKDLFITNSLDEAIVIAKKEAASAKGFGEPKEIFVIGGGQIYEQTIKKGLADKLYLTIIDASFDADTFFPDYSEFKKIVFEKKGESEGYKYKFLEIEKK